MSLLNPQYADVYKELRTCYPIFYMDVYEMQELLKVQGTLMDTLCGNLELTLNNNFINTADETTIQAWETALGIEYDNVLTLEERKIVVAAHISGHGHIGEPEIRSIVARYSSNPITVEFNVGIITINISGQIFDTTNLRKTLLSRIPAHLRLMLNIIYGSAAATEHVATAAYSQEIRDGATARAY